MRMLTGLALLLCFAPVVIAAPSDGPICLVGKPAPTFQLPDINGNIFSLDDDRGGDHQALLIVFWGVWCPYCREILVRLSEQYEPLRARGLEVIAIGIRESSAKVGLFINQLQPGFLVLIDEWAELKDRYLIQDVPLAVILDRDHVVRAAVITTSVDKVQAMIEEALGPETSWETSGHCSRLMSQSVDCLGEQYEIE